MKNDTLPLEENMVKIKLHPSKYSDIHSVVCNGCRILIDFLPYDSLMEWGDKLWCEDCYERRLLGIREYSEESDE